MGGTIDRVFPEGGLGMGGAGRRDVSIGFGALTVWSAPSCNGRSANFCVTALVAAMSWALVSVSSLSKTTYSRKSTFIIRPFFQRGPDHFVFLPSFSRHSHSWTKSSCPLDPMARVGQLNPSEGVSSPPSFTYFMHWANSQSGPEVAMPEGFLRARATVPVSPLGR